MSTLVDLLTYTEKKHVKEVYEKISTHFNFTRNHVWAGVKSFLDRLEANETLLEVGCGNGRNLEYVNNKQSLNIKTKGCDIVNNFLKICTNKNIDVCYGDQRSLPFSNNSYKYIISIAVLHHLEHNNDRIKAIKEIIRVLEPNGYAYIQVWKAENKSCDKFVKWTDKKNQTYDRYYHMFDIADFKLLFINNNIQISQLFEEKNNIICVIQKNNLTDSNKEEKYNNY